MSDLVIFTDRDLTELVHQQRPIFAEVQQLSLFSSSLVTVLIVDLCLNSVTLVEFKLHYVIKTQLQVKNDVLLEFHVDDTAGANEKDSLMEISFHIPNTNTKFVGDETRPPAQVFNDNILKVADVGAGVEEAIVTFEGVGTMWSCTFLSYVCKDKGTTLKFNTVVLPLVSASKDPPIRKGQTLYPHIVMQFETDSVVENDSYQLSD
ncbi:hypothetical protein Bca52824_002066 [Brassica carinata]|uniref:Uncharacterized protein n=1 Tax=Brassica carinata TaxID=52824 RepID=A0A8X7WII1_BRACI|nr:hypothetical protein Bca52824_002066 [Brassica carinata]